MRYFVIRGFGCKQDGSGTRIDFDRVDRELIAPALARCAFEGGTTAQVDEAGSIHEDMFALILEADVVVCDITVHNANVFYELGIRHALRRRHTVLIKGEPSADKTPFDIGGFRYLGYPVADPAASVDALASVIQSGLRGTRATDSPVFHFLPALPEAPSTAAVPPDFAGEVQRAVAARDRGWLRMLAEDLSQLRFERAGLHQVAFAQCDLQDFEPARQNLERLLRMGDTDVRLHFKLANIHERMYRRSGKAEHFERSQQAIQAALQQPGLAAQDHAEALSLGGRNLKTQWRMAFDKLSSLQERRRQACRRPLVDCRAAYRAAFRRDLNSFYAGLACLQATHVLHALSSEPGWPSMFRNAREAARYADALQEDLLHGTDVVAAAIEHGLEHGNADDRKWAAISEVDLRFLSDDEAALRADPSGLVAQYESALAGCEPFFRDAAIGQLELFASVGLRADVAEAVVAALRRAAPPAAGSPVRPHLVVFAGHVIDAPTRVPARFPAAAEPRARELIRERLLALKARHPALVVLASAAPGADILVHELCAELGLASVLCLPMPARDVAAQSFGTLDGWRNRLTAVAQRHGDDARVLQDGPELPRWLDPRKVGLWERGNRWTLRSAEAWDCDGRTLLALWDRDESNEATGGTGHVVRLARQAGVFEIDIIDSRALLGV